jgi:acyl-[acyl carrier protein]--UDP-N-acetylglucosamine O-acyltransferase
MDADEVCTDVLERIKVCALGYDVVIKNGNNLSSFVQISKKLANPLLTNYYDYIEISQDGKMLGTISFIKDDLDGYTICVIGTNGVNYSSSFEFRDSELERAVELITT